MTNVTRSEFASKNDRDGAFAPRNHPPCGVQLRGSVRRSPDFDACARSARASVCSDVTAASCSILAAGTVVRGTVTVRRQRNFARSTEKNDRTYDDFDTASE